jgi:hypothetical protein
VHDHRENIDDASGLAGFDQVPNHALHQQKRPGYVSTEHSVQKLGAGIQKGASIRQGCGVNQAVYGAKTLKGCGDKFEAVLWVRDISLHEDTIRAQRLDVSSRFSPLSRLRPLRIMPRAPSRTSRSAMAEPKLLVHIGPSRSETFRRDVSSTSPQRFELSSPCPKFGGGPRVSTMRAPSLVRPRAHGNSWVKVPTGGEADPS